MIGLTEQVKRVMSREEDQYTRFMCPTCGATVLITETDKLDTVEKPTVCGNCQTELIYD